MVADVADSGRIVDLADGASLERPEFAVPGGARFAARIDPALLPPNVLRIEQELVFGRLEAVRHFARRERPEPDHLAPPARSRRAGRGRVALPRARARARAARAGRARRERARRAAHEDRARLAARARARCASSRRARARRRGRLAPRLPRGAGARGALRRATRARACVGERDEARRALARAAPRAQRGDARAGSRARGWRSGWARRDSRRGSRRSRPRSRAPSHASRAHARAALLQRLPALRVDPRSRGLARGRRDRLPHDGAADARARGALHRRDGLRGRALDRPRALHRHGSPVPEPGRRHLLPLGPARGARLRRGRACRSPSRSSGTASSR